MYINWRVGVKHHITVLLLDPDTHPADANMLFMQLASYVHAPVIKNVDGVSLFPSSDGFVTVATIDCPELIELGYIARDMADEMGIVYNAEYDYNPHITMGEGVLYEDQWAFKPGDEVLLDKMALVGDENEIINMLYWHTHAQDVIDTMIASAERPITYSESELGGNTITVTPPKFVQEIASKALNLKKMLPAHKQAILPSGLKRANRLARGDELDLIMLKRMRGYIADNLPQVDEDQDDPSESKVLQGLMLWGSGSDDRTLKWLDRAITRIEKRQQEPIAFQETLDQATAPLDVLNSLLDRLGGLSIPIPEARPQKVENKGKQAPAPVAKPQAPVDPNQPGDGSRNCTKGQACRGSCISKAKNCNSANGEGSFTNSDARVSDTVLRKKKAPAQ